MTVQLNVTMENDLKTSELLTLEQVSKILSLSKETLRRWDRRGKLKAIRVGSRGDRRYRKIDIIDFVATDSNRKY